MSLHETIKLELKDALKSKDNDRLRTIRSMLTAFTNELVATSRTPQDKLKDDEVLTVIKRLAKQRKESIIQYESNNRPELAESEKAELVILESYLPKLMTAEEIRPIAEAKMTALGIVDKSKIGLLVGAIMKDLSGQADGSVVKSVVESFFAE